MYARVVCSKPTSNKVPLLPLSAIRLDHVPRSTQKQSRHGFGSYIKSESPPPLPRRSGFWDVSTWWFRLGCIPTTLYGRCHLILRSSRLAEWRWWRALTFAGVHLQLLQSPVLRKSLQMVEGVHTGVLISRVSASRVQYTLFICFLIISKTCD